MGWFGTSEPEKTYDPELPRLASDEFLSAFEEIAGIYDRRAKAARVSCRIRGDELSHKDGFNYHELDNQYLGQMRASILMAIQYEGLASEVRNWMRDYRDRGRRPPYLPPLPPPHQEG